jgi:hypothetical protein
MYFCGISLWFLVNLLATFIVNQFAEKMLVLPLCYNFIFYMFCDLFVVVIYIF